MDLSWFDNRLVIKPETEEEDIALHYFAERIEVNIHDKGSKIPCEIR